MTPERLAEIAERLDAPHGAIMCGDDCWRLAHEDAPVLVGEVERLQRIEKAARAVAFTDAQNDSLHWELVAALDEEASA